MSEILFLKLEVSGYISLKKDLNYIHKSFNLGLDVMKHEKNIIRVDVWVQEMTNYPDPCVLFYKFQGVLLQKLQN